MHVTIVTGTSRGLGLAVTQALSQRGHHVLAPGIIDTDVQLKLRSAGRTLLPEAERCAQLESDSRLDRRETAAARLLRSLDRTDFGSNPVADLRDA
jgi:NAD(P)-dependent dehydrogenase (short-subunit alcohol dehydrogenase family)